MFFSRVFQISFQFFQFFQFFFSILKRNRRYHEIRSTRLISSRIFEYAHFFHRSIRVNRFAWNRVNFFVKNHFSSRFERKTKKTDRKKNRRNRRKREKRRKKCKKKKNVVKRNVCVKIFVKHVQTKRKKKIKNNMRVDAWIFDRMKLIFFVWKSFFCMFKCFRWFVVYINRYIIQKTFENAFDEWRSKWIEIV